MILEIWSSQTSLENGWGRASPGRLSMGGATPSPILALYRAIQSLERSAGSSRCLSIFLALARFLIMCINGCAGSPVIDALSTIAGAVGAEVIITGQNFLNVARKSQSTLKDM